MDYFAPLQEVLEKRNDIDISEVRRAFEFAQKAHQGQMRKSGEEYITHPVAVAILVNEVGGDQESIIAALLHDTVEDTDVSEEDIQKKFGKNVSMLVEGMTKVSKKEFIGPNQERHTKTLQKIFKEGDLTEKALLVKLCDRMHNISDIESLAVEKQQRIAKETQDIYIPIAKIFGVWDFKNKMEDICFSILEPDEYSKTQEYLTSYQESLSKKLNEITSQLSTSLNIDKQNIQICFKNIFSISQKKEKVFYIKITTLSRLDCYSLIGKIHQGYQWKPSSFKDFISLPKANGYKSLFTSIFYKELLINIHIVSKEDILSNKYGFFFLKDHTSSSSIQSSIQELNKYYYSSGKYLQDLKQDVLNQKILILNEKGETFILPKGSTGIDMAYQINEKTGNTIEGIEINKKQYPAIRKLKNGETIKLILGEKENVKTYWLNYIKTKSAKNGIINSNEKLSNEKLIQKGKESLMYELQKQGKKYKINEKIKREMINFFPEKTYNDILIQVGKGVIPTRDFIIKYMELNKSLYEQSLLGRNINIALKWFYSNFYFLFTSYVKSSAKNVSKIKIEAKDEIGMLYKILGVISQQNINIAGLKIYSLRPSFHALYKIQVEVENNEELSDLFDHIREIKGIKNLTKE